MKLSGIIEHFYRSSNVEKEYDLYAQRTKYPRKRRIARYIFLGAFIALFGTLSVIAFVTEDRIIGAMMAALGSLLTLLPLSLCLQVWLSYEVITEEGITVHRVFSKKLIRYSDMTYYVTESRAYDDLPEIFIYGADNRRLVWIGAGRLGMGAIISTLNSHGIKQKETN